MEGLLCVWHYTKWQHFKVSGMQLVFNKVGQTYHISQQKKTPFELCYVFGDSLFNI